MTNVKINEVAVYHPDKVVKNDYYIQHFLKRGRDISHFLETMGRNERYIIEGKENTLSMGVQAAQQVLEKAGLKGSDMDVIVFSTQVPEITFPTNAMYVHHAIKGKSEAMVFDSNANCAGMTLAVEQATRNLLSNPDMKRALVVGSDYNSLVANPEEEITYANYGDAASAIILEKTEEETGFIDAMYDVDSCYRNNILFPEKGMSTSIQQAESVGHIRWTPFDGSLTIPAAIELIKKLLKKNGLTSNDIDAYCLSQFSIGNIKKLQTAFHANDDQMIYVGDKYGYTGTSSPFIALHEGIQSKRIKRGDTVLFWTVGAGNILIAMLFKY